MIMLKSAEGKARRDINKVKGKVAPGLNKLSTML
jgi:hypothetical protein